MDFDNSLAGRPWDLDASGGQEMLHFHLALSFCLLYKGEHEAVCLQNASLLKLDILT